MPDILDSLSAVQQLEEGAVWNGIKNIAGSLGKAAQAGAQGLANKAQQWATQTGQQAQAAQQQAKKPAAKKPAAKPAAAPTGDAAKPVDANKAKGLAGLIGKFINKVKAGKQAAKSGNNQQQQTTEQPAAGQTPQKNGSVFYQNSYFKTVLRESGGPSHLQQLQTYYKKLSSQPESTTIDDINKLKKILTKISEKPDNAELVNSDEFKQLMQDVNAMKPADNTDTATEDSNQPSTDQVPPPADNTAQQATDQTTVQQSTTTDQNQTAEQPAEQNTQQQQQAKPKVNPQDLKNAANNLNTKIHKIAVTGQSELTADDKKNLQTLLNSIAG